MGEQPTETEEKEEAAPPAAEEAKEGDSAPAEGEEGEGGGKKFPVVKIVNTTLLVLSIVGLITTIILSFVLTIPPDIADVDAQNADQAEDTEDIFEIGDLYALEPFVINLVDLGGRRFLKINLELELENPNAKELDEKLPYIRNIIINVLSNKTFDMVKTVEGKDKMRADVVLRINEILATNTVRNCYFTEFTAQ